MMSEKYCNSYNLLQQIKPKYLDETFSTKNGREMEEFKKNNSTVLKGDNLQNINKIGKSLESDLDNALYEPRFITSSIALNFESEHVDKI